jgi:Holliday junction resolvasome RuvABC endonuclease subunit
MRLIRLRAKLEEIATSVGADLVVYEAARHGAPKMAGALVVQAELQGVIKLWCEERRLAYRGYSPSEIKAHATGKGNASKAAVIAAAIAKFGAVKDDNQADALWLLDLATSEYAARAERALDVPRPADV